MKKKKVKLTEPVITGLTTKPNDSKSKTKKYGGGYTWVGVALILVIVLLLSSCTRNFYITPVQEFEKPATHTSCSHQEMDGYIFYKMNDGGLPDVNFENDSLKIDNAGALLLFQTFLKDILVFPQKPIPDINQKQI